MKRIFTVLYHCIWYTFAIIIINAAVFVTVIRLALPGIGEYKNEIQAWVSEYMGYPLVIENINAEWQGWVPQLYLNNIDLYTKDNSHIITKFDSAKVGIDLISSLIEREIVPSNLSVIGLDLELTRKNDGSITISSDLDDNQASVSSDSAALSEWLLRQKYIILENATLLWNDKKAALPSERFDNVRIELKTDGDRLQLDASVTLPEEYGQSLSAKVDVKGNVLTPDWSGEIFVSAVKINPGNLLEKYSVKSIGGNANINLWTRWKKAKLVDFNGKMDYANFVLKTNQYELPVNSVTVNFYGERKKNKNWSLDFKSDGLRTSYGPWPTANYHLDIDESDSDSGLRYSGYLSYLKLKEVLPFLIATNIIPDSILQKIDLKSINGELKNMEFIYDPNSITSSIFRFQFKNLNIASHDNDNAISGLDGTLTANSEKISIALDSQNSILNINSLYAHNFSISKLKANLEFTLNETPELFIHEFGLVYYEMPINLTGNIKFEKPSPFLDLVAHMGETNIEHIQDLLPKKTNTHLHSWLEQALAGGKILSGDLVFRGNVDDYPFENAEGNFKAILNIADVTLDYHQGWPPVDNFTAEVIMENNDLHIASNSGYIFDANINHLSAQIKNMGEQDAHIIVSSKLSGRTDDVRHFIEQSPLKNNASLFELSQTNIAGSLAINLNLDIPVGKPGTTANGTVTFFDTTIESSWPGLGLEDVNGKIEFTRHKAWASNIKALYHGKPVELSIPLDEQNEPGTSTFVLSGMADKIFIIEQLSSFFPSLYAPDNEINKYFDGQSQWTLTIKHKRDDKNITHKQIELSSNLKGIAIDLPYPLGKSKEEIRPLSIKTQFVNSTIDRIGLNYDNNIYTNFLVDNSADKLIKKIWVGLGHEPATTETSSDISVQGTLDKLNLSTWIDFINLKKISQPASDTAQNNKSIQYDIHVDKLKMLDNEFNNTDITLAQATDGWNASFNGDEIKGQAQLINANKNRNELLDVNMDYLVFKDNESAEKNISTVAIKKLPELNVKINKLTYKNNDLGQTTLLTSNINDGVNIDELSFTKPGFNIKASGKWTRIDEVDRSEFIATLESESIDSMLKTFGYENANIEGGQTRIKLNASWMDTPMNFSIDKVNGELGMNIAEGQFLDINPSAGRLFGLLSIQTLPRRLSLDFTDIFSKGFSFDSIKGNFSLQQGHAYTNDLEMNGPSADIIVSGRTGLITEDYDQIATVTPKISDSLPVTSALFGPIGVGVGAVFFIAGELFESLPKKIDKILSQQYSIKGSWDSPDIKKINKEKQSG